MRLFKHTTDGGAEYLCTKPIEGTDEGDLRTTVVRLDGEPEMYPTMSSLLQFVEDIERYISAGGITTKDDKRFVLLRANEARRGIEVR